MATVPLAATVWADAAVPFDAEPAAMAPVSTRATTALDAPVICRARRAGWGRRWRVGPGVGVVGAVSMPR